MKDKFISFLKDRKAKEMYITGPAGSGKTTNLHILTDYCHEQNLKYVVCSFTHKACNILRAKLPPSAEVRTLHSYLKKRPGVNVDAVNYKHIDVNIQVATPDRMSILFIDEYSMVGEKDLMSIRELEDDELNPNFKVVFIGDPNQLPPVGDKQTVKPCGKYAIMLNTIYRQGKDNPLLDALAQLVSFINGAEPEPLKESDKLIRNQDVVEWYQNDSMSDDFDGILLAFTNERVQQMNAQIEGKDEPDSGDRIFCPTTKEFYTFGEYLIPSNVYAINSPFKDDMIYRGSKYRTLEYLIEQGYQFASVYDENENECIFPFLFGHYTYKLHAENLKKSAASANAAIGSEAAKWARENPESSKARTRAEAWRKYLSFNSSVVCLDFAHAITVHKSQGSTYKTVYVDTNDIGTVANRDYQMYLKLMYVALSRASDTVITT